MLSQGHDLYFNRQSRVSDKPMIKYHSLVAIDILQKVFVINSSPSVHRDLLYKFYCSLTKTTQSTKHKTKRASNASTHYQITQHYYETFLIKYQEQNQDKVVQVHYMKIYFNAWNKNKKQLIKCTFLIAVYWLSNYITIKNKSYSQKKQQTQHKHYVLFPNIALHRFTIYRIRMKVMQIPYLATFPNKQTNNITNKE